MHHCLNGPISQYDDVGIASHFLQDAQNSTRVLTDSNGGITQSYTYSAYGDLLGGTAANTNYLYTGQRLDAITGDYYLRARQYDPSLGRFMGMDTWPLDYDYPVELNRYVYAAASKDDPKHKWRVLQ